MAKSRERTILEEVTNFYLQSRDFNGTPVRQINARYKRTNLRGLKAVCISLVQQDKLCIVFGDQHSNPHIKALPDEPHEVQIEKLQNTDLLRNACIYPSASHLKSVVDVSLYQGKPFALRLALGEPQLAFESFDLRVLEDYRNDPRYYYRTDDIRGSISASDTHGEMRSTDQVVLQSFGFCYDSELHPAVAVFLRYLSNLSPEHQQIWNARIVKGDYKLHPDYFKAMILGSWDLGVSMFDAFIEELHIINDMCKLIGRPALFKQEFSQEKKPRELSFLVRPTLKELNAFIHLLDKILSENINKKFFGEDIALEQDETRKRDGKIIVREKGTLQLLEEWLNKNYKTPYQEDTELTIQMFKTFREIRQRRQKPAHAVNEDSFDQSFFQQQRELMIRAYEAIRTLRQAFEFHPKVRDYKIPNWLESGKIWAY